MAVPSYLSCLGAAFLAPLALGQRFATPRGTPLPRLGLERAFRAHSLRCRARLRAWSEEKVRQAHDELQRARDKEDLALLVRSLQTKTARTESATMRVAELADLLRVQLAEVTPITYQDAVELDPTLGPAIGELYSAVAAALPSELGQNTVAVGIRRSLYGAVCICRLAQGDAEELRTLCRAPAAVSNEEIFGHLFASVWTAALTNLVEVEQFRCTPGCGSSLEDFLHILRLVPNEFSADRHLENCTPEDRQRWAQHGQFLRTVSFGRTAEDKYHLKVEVLFPSHTGCQRYTVEMAARPRNPALTAGEVRNCMMCQMYRWTTEDLAGRVAQLRAARLDRQTPLALTAGPPGSATADSSQTTPSGKQHDPAANPSSLRHLSVRLRLDPGAAKARRPAPRRLFQATGRRTPQQIPSTTATSATDSRAASPAQGRSDVAPLAS